MLWIKRVLYALVLIVGLLLGVLISRYNREAVVLHLGPFYSAQASLAVWVLSAFIVGAGIGLLYAWYRILRIKVRPKP